MHLLKTHFFTHRSLIVKRQQNIIELVTRPAVDKALHSLGPRSGYFLPNASLPNPVDAVLVLAQRAFPLDYIVYSGMVLFFLLRSDLCAGCHINFKPNISQETKL